MCYLFTATFPLIVVQLWKALSVITTMLYICRGLTIHCTTIKLFFVLNNTSIHDRSYAIKITFLCRSLGIAPKSPFLLRLIRFTVTISRTRVCAFFLPPQHHSTRSPLPSIHHTLTGRLLICTIIIVERMSSSDRHPVRNIQSHGMI